MSQPPPYNRLANFTNYALAHPSSPYNPSDHDAELNAIETTVDALCTNIALIQRDDGKLRNESVGIDQLETEVRAIIAVGEDGKVEPWVTGHVYNPGDAVSFGVDGYLCVIAHVAGTFGVDLGAGKWVLIGLTSIAAVNQAALVTYAPNGTISSTNVQAALTEVAADAAAATAAVGAASIPLVQKGAPNGVATLDGAGKVPVSQVPDLSGIYVALTQKAAANGVATLDAAGKVPLAQLPDAIAVADLTLSGNLIVGGNTTLGNAAADTLTVNAGTWTYGAAVTATRNMGQLNSASPDFFVRRDVVNVTSDGTGFPNCYVLDMTFSDVGAAPFLVGTSYVVKHAGSGLVSNFRLNDHYAELSAGATGNATNVSVYHGRVQARGAGNINLGQVFVARKLTDGTGVITSMQGFCAEDLGDATRVTNAFGFQCNNFTVGPAFAAAYRGAISAGAGRWNLYMDGTAANFLAGDLTVGGVLVAGGIGFTDLVVTGNTTLGDAAADTLTINAGAWTLGSNITATRDMGALSAFAVGITEAFSFTTTALASAIARSIAITGSGANAMGSVTGISLVANYAGSFGLTNGVSALDLTTKISGAGNAGTDLVGIRIRTRVEGAGNVNSTVYGTFTDKTVTSTGTMNLVRGHAIGDLGDATRVANAAGFLCNNFTAGPAFAGAFVGLMASGTGRWNAYMEGTAMNYFGGPILQGPDGLAARNANQFFTEFYGLAMVGGTPSVPYGILAAMAKDNGNSNFISFLKARGTPAAPTPLQLDDEMGGLFFGGLVASLQNITAASIRAFCDGTVSSTELPGRLAFYTRPAGGSSAVERMRIFPNGGVVIHNVGAADPALQLVCGAGAGGIYLRGRVADNAGSIIWSDNSGGTVKGVIAVDSGDNMAFRTGPGQVNQLYIIHVASAVNYVFAQGNVAGGRVTVGSNGTDANIDLFLFTKGTGVVSFGTHTASGDVAVNGSILIKDATGATRKLATVA